MLSQNNTNLISDESKKINYYKKEFSSRSQKKEDEVKNITTNDNPFHCWSKLPKSIKEYTLSSFTSFNDFMHFSETSKINAKSTKLLMLKRYFPQQFSELPIDCDYSYELKKNYEHEKNSVKVWSGDTLTSPNPRAQRLIQLFKDGRLSAIKEEKVTLVEIFNIQDGQEISLITWAHRKGHQHILDFFYGEVLNKFPDDVDINYHSPELFNTTLLYWAACLNQINVVKTLLLNKADIHSRNLHQETPLWIACWTGCCNIVQLFLDKKANLNLPNDNGITPLYISAKSNDYFTTKILLKHDAQTDIADIHIGSTPLMTAAHYGNIAIIELLLEYNADINKTNKFSSTALHYAISSNKPDVVQLLLENNANLKVLPHNVLDMPNIQPYMKNLVIAAEIDLLLKNVATDNFGFFNQSFTRHRQLRQALFENDYNKVEKLASNTEEPLDSQFREIYTKALNLSVINKWIPNKKRKMT